MKAYQARFPVRVMSRVLKVSASGFYAWLLRLPSQHARADVLLGDRIEAISLRSRSTYGRPRIHAELAEDGICVSGKRVARLMRNRNVCGASRRKTTTTTIRDRDAKPAPDLVDRRFLADAPNQLWVVDITYVPTWNGFLYLAVVLDVFSRRIVGWAMADHSAKNSCSTHSTWRSFGENQGPSFTIPIKARNTPRWHLRSAAVQPEFDRR